MAVKLTRKRDEDLFHESTMTFGEHLEELRSALFKSLIFLMGGFIVGLLIGRQVVLGIQAPLKSALVRYYEGDAMRRIEAERIKTQAEGPAPEAGEGAADEMIQGEGMIFQPVYLRVDEIFEGLSRAYPDEFGDVKLPQNPPEHRLSIYGPIHVLAADLVSVPKLCEKLYAASTAAQPGPARRFWDRLSQADQALVVRLGLVPGVSDEERDQVTEMLENMLDDEDLYDKEAFKETRLTPEGRALLERVVRTEPEQRRLNRLLLEAAFPDLVATTHAPMLSVSIWQKIADDQRTRIQSLSPAEVFGFYIKASLIVGIILGSPGIFYYLWSFVGAGLYPHEKRYVYVFMPFSILLFLAGAALAFFFVFQPVLDFLFEFNQWLEIDPDPRISEWLGFVLLLPLAFGVSFQLPLVLLFLERIGVFTVEVYLAKWRVAVLIIFVAAMILTPSMDPISMLLMALPLTILYFGAIGLCKWLPRMRSPYDE